MAASWIKGIMVEINGDTTGLNKALESVNKNIKSTQSQLKDVEKLLKLDSGNTETLEIVSTEMYSDGYNAVRKADTSYKGLWKVSFTLKEF